MQNKKAQVGDTVTWIIATIVIVVILVFFIFGASMLASTKNIGKYKESLFSSGSSYEGDDMFLKKSIYSFILTSDVSRKKIEKDLDNKDIRKEFDLPLNVTMKSIRGRVGK